MQLMLRGIIMAPPRSTRPRARPQQDDPHVCPPAMLGQLPLFEVSRLLTEKHARRIRGRDLPDCERLEPSLIRLADTRGYSQAWKEKAALALRLALAVRDADGQELVAEEALDDLPFLRHRLAVAWVEERSRRWPRSHNPHLLISLRTAFDVRHPPLSEAFFTALGRERLHVNLSRLRVDRVLDEARHTADPVHLMRLFGLSVGAAVKYVNTAHPGRNVTVKR